MCIQIDIRIYVYVFIYFLARTITGSHVGISEHVQNSLLVCSCSSAELFGKIWPI